MPPAYEVQTAAIALFVIRYATDPLILVGLGLWLESYLAVFVAIIPLTCVVVGLYLEERFLQRE